MENKTKISDRHITPDHNPKQQIQIHKPMPGNTDDNTVPQYSAIVLPLANPPFRIPLTIILSDSVVFFFFLFLASG